LDEPALYGTLASPLVGCSSDALALLASAAHAAGWGVWDTARRVAAGAQAPRPRAGVGADGEGAAARLLARLPSADRDALGRFTARLQEERRAAPLRTISQLIERGVDASGYREHVLGLEWGERRLANVHKLLGLARRFEASERRDLRGFLDHAADLQEASGGAEPDA